MEINKPCQICQKKLAKHTCKLDGNFVCDDHFKDGMCTSHKT